jgi:membrane protein DedA with SNARE-associated domain
MTLSGSIAYGAIFLAAMLEGEVVFVAASVIVAAGQLNVMPVLVAGALGAATGDQIYFYALRGRVSAWLMRFRVIAARHPVIVSRVRRHQVLMILALRFAPGLRIAIAAACAYADVSRLRFSALNTLMAFVWAGGMLTLVTKVGPAALTHAGVSGLGGAAVAAVLVVSFSWWLGRELAT